MATPASIRPSISRIVNSARVFPGAHATLGAALPSASPQRCPFSSTPEYNTRRPRRDNNRFRGLSSIYRSGTRFRMNIDKSETPQPADYMPEVKVDPNHGLWDFFYSKDKLLLTPQEDREHGRAWTVEELRHKSWEDLHKLWWVCVKEQNRLLTARKERTRLQLVNGISEGAGRLNEVRRTMRAIKHALTERWYLWEDARTLAETDPEIDLGNVQSPFTPKDYLENETETETETETALEGNNQDGSTEQAPSGFMAEEPRVTKPEEVEPSTISPEPAQTQQPSVKP
ncbi:mitochondrial 39-S ribosomal protein L47 (MRP-L47)-domain-containing protein [Xylaria cf. heliscus]|nr:mitochondrial 39-S ribosomal protein L47 (MRP-L47)-domain-containing protein [Xylaria cf. heliscus]